MKHTFFSVQATYSHAQVSLFRDGDCIDTLHLNDQKASSHLIPSFQSLLNKHQLTIEDIGFIAIDQGPGAFTSLRTAIATVNGIAFTKKVRVIGIDGLDALMYEGQELVNDLQKDTAFVALLNAYNNDVYFAISYPGSDTVEKGCVKIDVVSEMLVSGRHKKFVFFGNGAFLHEQILKTSLGEQACTFLPIQTPSARTIGLRALKSLDEGGMLSDSLQPNYMKTQYFAVQKPFNVPQT